MELYSLQLGGQSAAGGENVMSHERFAQPIATPASGFTSTSTRHWRSAVDPSTSRSRITQPGHHHSPAQLSLPSPPGENPSTQLQCNRRASPGPQSCSPTSSATLSASPCQPSK